jgi:hypothetical protein
LYCVRCGAQMLEGQRFCPACGTPAHGAVPLMPTGGRIAGHVRMLGILWVAISAFRLLPGFALVTLFHPGFMHMGVPFLHAGVFGGLLRGFGLLLLAGAVLGLVAGFGLLQRQPWARSLTIILGCLNLIDMPFGTALGIYTLWVLLPAKSEEEYRQIAQSD